MKVKGTAPIEVSIDRNTQVRIAIETLCQAYNFKPNYSVEENVVVEYVEQYTSHRWEERNIIRAASFDDRQAAMAIGKIESWLYSEKSANVRPLKGV